MSRREFHFSEGSSDKFWAIEVDGKQFTVQFGRQGTAGQTQAKKFSSEAEARAAADKLIAEKVKKGYVEAGASPAAPAASAAPATPKAAKAKAKAPAPAAAPPAAPPAPATPPVPVVTHTIDLEPVHWMWATWRPRQP